MSPLARAAVLLCCAVALLGHVRSEQPRAEFIASDYGDVIDGLRRQLDADALSRGGDPESPSSMTRIRLRLRDIEDRLRTEDAAAAKVFKIQFDYLNNTRLAQILEDLQTTQTFVDETKNKTRTNSDRIVDRQIYLKRMPTLQKRKQKQIDDVNRSIAEETAQRIRANIRYHHRLQHAKDTLAATEHVSAFLDPASFADRLVTLKDTLNVHADPSMNRLITSLGPDIMQATKHDLGDVNDLINTLSSSLHEFILDITKTEVNGANASALRIDGMNEMLDLLVQELDHLKEDEADAKKEVTELMNENIKMHKQYPGKVFKLERLQKLKEKVLAALEPLVAVYNQHAQQRAQQLADVVELQATIARHFDAVPKNPGPQ